MTTTTIGGVDMLPDWAVNPDALRRPGAVRLLRASRRLRLR